MIIGRSKHIINLDFNDFLSQLVVRVFYSTNWGKIRMCSKAEKEYCVSVLVSLLLRLSLAARAPKGSLSSQFLLLLYVLPSKYKSYIGRCLKGEFLALGDPSSILINMPDPRGGNTEQRQCC
jgi:hypothetical protein